MVTAKLFFHPFLAFVAFAYLLNLDPLWANAGVIFAACPVDLNVYVFAESYEVAIETASSAILISTARDAHDHGAFAALAAARALVLEHGDPQRVGGNAHLCIEGGER
jgi:hypothetical protein